MDLTPKYTTLTAEEEIVIPANFQDNSGQLVGGFSATPAELTQGKIKLQGIAERFLIGDATLPLTGTGVFIGWDGETTKNYDFRVGDPSANYIHWDGSLATLTIVGSITATSGSVGGWSVSSTAIYFNGATDALSAGMAPADYPFYAGKKYVDRATAPFRVNTAGDLFASSATITGSITTGFGSTINGTYIDSLDVSKLNAGTITSKSITLAVAGGTGDVKIQAGKTDFTNTESGFILGIDDSDSDKAKFYLGDTNNYINWDGSSLTVLGNINLGGTNITVSAVADIQTALNDVFTAGGGTVYLQAGTYLLTADITIPSGVTLQGINRDTVIIDCNSSYAVKMVGSDNYSTGDVTIADGSSTVTGTSTVWTAGMIGRYIYLYGYWYEITGRTSNTEITIGVPYDGPNLTNSVYMIANPNFHSIVRKITVQNATGAGVISTYSSEPIFDDIQIFNCGTGLDLDYIYAPNMYGSFDSNGVALNMNYCDSFKIDYCAFVNSTVGAGIIMTNCNSSTVFDTGISGNTGNGITLTGCTNITFLSVNSNTNGANGIELVSGNSDLEFISMNADSNVGDGYKLTATTDNITIIGSSITNNGAYGINNAAATNDRCIFSSNVITGNVTASGIDSGTSTIIRGNYGWDDNGTNALLDLVIFSASDNLKFSADTLRIGNSDTYELKKQITVRQGGTVRIKFDLKQSNSGSSAFARIYINEIAVGTEQQSSGATYTTFSQDINIKAFDRIQLYAKDTSGSGSDLYQVKNFRIYYDRAVTTVAGVVDTD
jgi:hypothetical protein